MEATGETCKLCLKYIQGPSLAVLDENLLSKLEFLQMDLDQSVEESNSVCKECEEKIESAFDFKSCIVPSGSEEQTQKGTNDPSTSTGESSAEKAICHLCKNSVNATAVISLPKVLKDDSMMEVFQGHIPEMDLEGIENKMVCDACQKSLASFSTLIASWSIANGWNDDEDMKEDFDDFEMVQVKKEGFDELSDSNTNSSMGNNEVGRGAKSLKKTKSKNGQATVVKIKTEGDGLSDSCESASVNEKDIKKEPEGGAEMEDLQLKSEEVDIKPEDEDGKKRGIRHLRRSKTKNQQLQIESSSVHFKSMKRKRNLEKNLSIHKNKLGTNNFKCRYCEVQTKRKWYLRKHELTHENPNETEQFNCELCSFTTKYKYSLTRHIIKHKNVVASDDVMVYKCQFCEYQTYRKVDLRNHSWVHKRKTFECPNCTYATKCRQKFKSHALVHKTIDEVQTFSCQECTFVTKYKYGLRRHALIHRSGEEVPLFNCNVCSFTTKYESYIKQHVTKHKNIQEGQEFTSEQLPYKTTFKFASINQTLRHKSLENFDETAIFKCVHCTYQTYRKDNILRHSLIHKNGGELQPFKCDQCNFETKRKADLSMHKLSHRNGSDMEPLACQQCPYKTRNKAVLKLHAMVHRNLDEVQSFNCCDCTFRTKYKSALRRHLLVHKSLH